MDAQPNAKALELVLQAVPYPHLIRDIDLHTQPDVLRFTWRGSRYRVGEHLHVEEVDGDVLIGSDLAILMERTIRLAHSAVASCRMVLPA